MHPQTRSLSDPCDQSRQDLDDLVDLIDTQIDRFSARLLAAENAAAEAQRRTADLVDSARELLETINGARPKDGAAAVGSGERIPAEGNAPATDGRSLLLENGLGDRGQGSVEETDRERDELDWIENHPPLPLPPARAKLPYLLLLVALLLPARAAAAGERVLEVHVPDAGPITIKDLTPATRPATQPAQPDYIAEGADLPSIIPPPATYNLKPGAVYVASKPFPDVVGPIRFTGGGPAVKDRSTVRYTGPEGDGYLFAMGPAASLLSSGVNWENANATKDSQKWGNLSFIHAGGVGTTLKNGTVRGFSNGVLIEQPARNVLIQNVSAEDVRSYFFYGGPGGDGATLDGVIVRNSTVEAACRIEGTKNVAVTDCTFEDEDNRPMGVAFDYAKSSFRPHVFDGLIVKRCRFALFLRKPDGTRVPIYDSNPIDLGPLGSLKDAPPERTRGDRGVSARFEDCEIWGAVGLTHGLDGIVFDHCTWHTGGGTAIVCSGYSADYDRTVQDVTLANCLFSTDQPFARVLWVLSPGAKGLVFNNCIVSAPNAVSGAAYDAMQIVVNDGAWPVSFKGCTFQQPKFGPPGNAVARQGGRYLSIEDFLKDFPGNTFAPPAAPADPQPAAPGVGVRPLTPNP
jgi:hypothetical protein